MRQDILAVLLAAFAAPGFWELIKAAIEKVAELFTGRTLPGACDVQVENPAGSRNMCAKYMFQGTDSAGNECRLFVENNGYLAEVMRHDPFFHAYPRFMTDSPVLGEYLSQQRFRSEVQGREWGVEIRIYDVLKTTSFTNPFFRSIGPAET